MGGNICNLRSSAYQSAHLPSTFLFSILHPPAICTLHTTNCSTHQKHAGQPPDPPASLTKCCHSSPTECRGSPQIPTGEYFPSQQSHSVTLLTLQPTCCCSLNQACFFGLLQNLENVLINTKCSDNLLKMAACKNFCLFI